MPRRRQSTPHEQLRMAWHDARKMLSWSFMEQAACHEYPWPPVLWTMYSFAQLIAFDCSTFSPLGKMHLCQWVWKRVVPCTLNSWVCHVRIWMNLEWLAGPSCIWECRCSSRGWVLNLHHRIQWWTKTKNKLCTCQPVSRVLMRFVSILLFAQLFQATKTSIKPSIFSNFLNDSFIREALLGSMAGSWDPSPKELKWSNLNWCWLSWVKASETVRRDLVWGGQSRQPLDSYLKGT